MFVSSGSEQLDRIRSIQITGRYIACLFVWINYKSIGWTVDRNNGTSLILSTTIHLEYTSRYNARERHHTGGSFQGRA